MKITRNIFAVYILKSTYSRIAVSWGSWLYECRRREVGRYPCTTSRYPCQCCPGSWITKRRQFVMTVTNLASRRTRTSHSQFVDDLLQVVGRHFTRHDLHHLAADVSHLQASRNSNHSRITRLTVKEQNLAPVVTGRSRSSSLGWVASWWSRCRTDAAGIRRSS